MDRRIPDVWDIFSLTGPEWSDKYASQRRQSNDQESGIHTNWSPHARNTQMLRQWCDRSSICDRPRTYDKFYQRGPSNYYDPSRPPDSLGCSSDTEDALDGPHIPSVDGTSSQRCFRRKRKKGGKNSGLQYSRTITENDVRTIERHLSMKKTIRKKIMRDLQQAFVGDPGDFEAPPEAVPPEQRSKINLSNLKFDPKLKDPTFLDLLRGGSGADQGGGREADHQGKAAAVISRLTGRVRLNRPTVNPAATQESLVNTQSRVLNHLDIGLEAQFQKRVNINGTDESDFNSGESRSHAFRGRMFDQPSNSLVHGDWRDATRDPPPTTSTANAAIDGKIIQTKSELRKKKRKQKAVEGDEVKKKSVWSSIFTRS